MLMYCFLAKCKYICDMENAKITTGTVLQHDKQGFTVVFKNMVSATDFRTADDFQYRLAEFTPVDSLAAQAEGVAAIYDLHDVPCFDVVRYEVTTAESGHEGIFAKHSEAMAYARNLKAQRYTDVAVHTDKFRVSQSDLDNGDLLDPYYTRTQYI